ncbi:MAG TPA: hypothetical protein VEC01_18950 [Noviherbaspirillum sp.]|nr:hypothetical protein [Noviherbaspirillum sp.]HYD97408.1 hypothetical protein [Noviherbaspirillum sp.]
MNLYLSAVVLTIAVTVSIVGSCILNGSATRAAPDNIIQPK